MNLEPKYYYPWSQIKQPTKQDINKKYKQIADQFINSQHPDLKRSINKQIQDYTTESNDNTKVNNVQHRQYNQHLKQRTIAGAKSNALWEKEHPTLSTLGYTAAAAPFVVASAPAWIPAGDAVAGTTVGHGISSVLTNPYFNAAITTSGGMDAANKIYHGEYGKSPIQDAFTTTELVPVLGAAAKGADRLYRIGQQLNPQNIRNWIYVSKVPIAYQGIWAAIKATGKGVLSGEDANINNPWWSYGVYGDAAKDLLNTYMDTDNPEVLQHALEARTDAWRMRMKLPQKFNTFTPVEGKPNTYTDLKGIELLKGRNIPNLFNYFKFENENPDKLRTATGVLNDFINTSGGGMGAKLTLFPKQQGQSSNIIYGRLNTSDIQDYYPFERSGDRLIDRASKVYSNVVRQPLQRMGNRLEYLGNKLSMKGSNPFDDNMDFSEFDPSQALPKPNIYDKTAKQVYKLSRNVYNKGFYTPKFNFLKPLDNRLARLEAANAVGGATPFTVEYNIPLTLQDTDSPWMQKILDTSYPLKNFQMEDIVLNQ